jgi:hypothetical protein
MKTGISKDYIVTMLSMVPGEASSTLAAATVIATMTDFEWNRVIRRIEANVAKRKVAASLYPRAQLEV